MPHEPLWRRYRRFWRPDVRADVDDELRFHLGERVDDLVALGMTPTAAAARAREEFGDVDAVRHRLRAIGQRRVRRLRWIDRLDAARHDVAYAARSLRRSPTLALTIVVTLALGLGANGAVFAIVDRLFFRPPAGVVAPNGVRRLYVTTHDHSGTAQTRDLLNYPEYLDASAAIGHDARVTVYHADDQRLGVDADALTVVFAGPGYFPLLGVRPALGRFFGGDEERIDVAAPVAVLSDAAWRDRFGADRSIVGRTVELDHERLTIVGVAPPRFEGVDVGAAAVWRPLGALPVGPNGNRAWYQTRNFYGLRVLTRPTADVRGVAARATTALRHGDPLDGYLDTLAVVRLGPIVAERGPGEPTREVSIAARLGIVALLVLLIACANVANLLLARAVQRRREIAVRVALGVHAARLRTLLLADGVLLAATAAAASLVATAWGGAALRRWLLPNVHWDGGAVDWRIVAFIGIVAILAGLLAALPPTISASRPDLSRALKAGAREGTVQRSRLRAALLVVQAALSVVLLVAAGLFVRSLQNVRSLDLGYDVDHIVTATAIWNEPRASDAVERAHRVALAAALPEIAERLTHAPGVARVARATMAPMWGFSFLTLHVDGRDSLPNGPGGTPTFQTVSPDYFAAVGMRVLRGRPFAEADRADAPLVAIVNETMARTLWPSGDALGHCLRFGRTPGPCRTIVGVVSDARRDAVIEDPAMQFYLPIAQPSDPRELPSTLVLRIADPERAADVITAAQRELVARFPDATPRVRRMADQLAPELRPWRLGATLFSLLGALALLVAAVGVYGTLAHAVGRRTHEFGVRIALGARGRHVRALVLRDGVRDVAIGAAIGLVLALAGGRLVASLLYGVSSHDPVVLGVVVLVLLGTALVAGFVPALRASRTAPAVALRDD